MSLEQSSKRAPNRASISMLRVHRKVPCAAVGTHLLPQRKGLLRAAGAINIKSLLPALLLYDTLNLSCYVRFSARFACLSATKKTDPRSLFRSTGTRTGNNPTCSCWSTGSGLKFLP